MDFYALGPEQVDDIVAVTNDRGPFEADLHYFIFAGSQSWRVGLHESDGLFDNLRREFFQTYPKWILPWKFTVEVHRGSSPWKF